ncbi:hypothetical protein ACHAXR_006907, partial [Thalassiosira sp. AJA248-18]
PLAIPSPPLLVILAINRGQDVYQAPLALPQEATDGTILMECTKCQQSIRGIQSLSWVFSAKIAIYTNFICKVDKGVVKEYHKKALLLPMQVVLVDDRCNDGSIDAMIKASDDLVKSHEDVSYTMQDHRAKGTPKQKDLVAGGQCVSISLDIVHSPCAGVASALNHGLSYCRANIVARMDADGIASPGRLLSQTRFMCANTSIDAAGTSTVLFSEIELRIKKEQLLILPYGNLIQNTESYCILRSSLLLSDPGFMAWAMFFTCCISHPSVFYRRTPYKSLVGTANQIHVKIL